VALELLQEADSETTAPRPAAGSFTGDFVDGRAARRRRAKAAGRARAGKSGAKAAAALRGSAAVRARWQAKRESSNRQLRLVALASVGALVAVLAMAWNGVTAANTPEPKRVAAPHGMQPAAFLEDMRMFLPATATMKDGDTLTVMVDRSWLVQPVDKRQQEAQEAHTYLLNRNVPQLALRWTDGRIIASFQNERMAWHESMGDDAGLEAPVPIDWH